jgi:peroxiredoxin
MGNGVKEDFYLAQRKPLVSDAALPGLDASAGPAQDLTIPSLDGTNTDASAAVINAPVGLKVGQRAPDFSAQLLDGGTVSLSDYRGQVVLLNFWATWCNPCREEMPVFQTVYETRADDGFVVLAVNYTAADQENLAREFVDEFDLTFPVALDKSGAINEKLYGQATRVGYPANFLIDRNGIIAGYYPGGLDGDKLLAALADLLES